MMKIFALLLLTTLASVAEGQTQTYFVNSVNERAVPCQNDPRLIAYKHVTDINVDQRAELQRIANGEPSRAPYVFPLCHNFAYNMSQEVLQVLLPGIVFACGYSGANDERCFLRFGENQVNIPSDFTSDVTFQGITFDSFSGISTKAYGAPGSKVIFNDVKWSEFANKAVGVEMRNPAGGTAMSAEVTDALYEGGDGGDMFINDGGTLAMTNVTIRRLQQIGRIGARAESIIATKNGGTSTLTKVSASESFLTKITHTQSGSTQIVSDVVIENMGSFGTAFLVEGSGSTLTVSDVICNNNRLKDAYDAKFSRNFNLVIAMDESTANVNNVDFGNNDGVDRVFGASTGAQVDVMDANVYNSQGTSPPDLLSNIAMAEDGGIMNVMRLNITNVDFFSAFYFATCGSTVQVKQSCAWSAEDMGTPAFISADSDMISEGNFLNLTDIGSTECKNATAGAVYKETNVASQCFSNTGTGVCNGGCTAGFAEAADCLIGGGSTFAFSTVTPLIAAGDNPSCPASPPTPIPTLPPQPTSAPAPQTALIPCGNPGAPADCDDQGNNNQGNNNQGQDDNNPGTGPITSTSNEGTGPIYDANNGDSGSGGGGSGAVSTCSMGLSHVVLLVGSLLCKMMMA